MDEIKICKLCLMPSSRPRVTFNENQICNACEYIANKKKLIGMKEKKNF